MDGDLELKVKQTLPPLSYFLSKYSTIGKENETLRLTSFHFFLLYSSPLFTLSHRPITCSYPVVLEWDIHEDNNLCFLSLPGAQHFFEK